MGLIQMITGSGVAQAAGGAIGSSLGDQWQDAFEANDMGEGIVFTKGVKLRAGDERNKNRKGTDDLVTQGSRIHVYDAQAMMVTDGGRITNFTAVPGVYTLDNTGQPTIFTGDLKGSLLDTWERFKFGGTSPQKQQIFYVNLQEIKGIKFGTPSALNYFDTFYNADPTFNDRWKKMGIMAIEMETAGLYATAAEAGVEALGIFTVSDSIVTGAVTTPAERQTAFTQMMELALSLAGI